MNFRIWSYHDPNACFQAKIKGRMTMNILVYDPLYGVVLECDYLGHKVKVHQFSFTLPSNYFNMYKMMTTKEASIRYNCKILILCIHGHGF